MAETDCAQRVTLEFVNPSVHRKALAPVGLGEQGSGQVSFCLAPHPFAPRDSTSLCAWDNDPHCLCPSAGKPCQEKEHLGRADSSVLCSMCLCSQWDVVVQGPSLSVLLLHRLTAAALKSSSEPYLQSGSSCQQHFSPDPRYVLKAGGSVPESCSTNPQHST